MTTKSFFFDNDFSLFFSFKTNDSVETIHLLTKWIEYIFVKIIKKPRITPFIKNNCSCKRIKPIPTI